MPAQYLPAPKKAAGLVLKKTPPGPGTRILRTFSIINERGTNMGKERITVRIDKELEDLIPGYIQHRQEDIAAIKNALTAGGFESIRVLGHSMKGSGGGYGFDRITEIGRAIEESAQNKDPAAILAHIDELADYLSRVEIVYS